MALHNLWDLLARGTIKASGKTLKGPAGYMLCWGVTAPADNSTGYAPGCLFIDTNGTNNTTVLACNIGSVLLANFDYITIA